MASLQTTSVACCVLLGVHLTALGQIVRVSPAGSVDVRAPFVHVHVDPSGGTSVRAPFTSLFVPGRHRAGPLSSSLALPRAETRIPDDYRGLRRELRNAALALERSLAQMEQGDRWQQALQPDRIRALVADDVEQPLDASARFELRQIQYAYDAVIDEQRRQGMTIIPGISSLGRLLVAALEAPTEKKLRQLKTSSQQLDRDLGQFSTGSTWQQYLQLPAGIIEAPVPQEERLTIELLVKFLQRFDSVLAEPSYRMISSLDSFVETRNHLAEYLGLVEDLGLDGSPAIEQLPPP